MCCPFQGIMRLRAAELKSRIEQGGHRRSGGHAPDVPMVDRRGRARLRHAGMVCRSAARARRRLDRRRHLLDRSVRAGWPASEIVRARPRSPISCTRKSRSRTGAWRHSPSRTASSRRSRRRGRSIHQEDGAFPETEQRRAAANWSARGVKSSTSGSARRAGRCWLPAPPTGFPAATGTALRARRPVSADST